ncbi:hypothetical protein, partial [Gordonia sp. 852002-50395_SCH5434458]|uniref:hypothetical protein n=1 Tax=Gordonia sp. 852002-50395_SCH5434458 TaxID=1834090 RepID=UPI001E389E4B
MGLLIGDLSGGGGLDSATRCARGRLDQRLKAARWARGGLGRRGGLDKLDQRGLRLGRWGGLDQRFRGLGRRWGGLLYTSDAADDR